MKKLKMTIPHFGVGESWTLFQIFLFSQIFVFSYFRIFLTFPSLEILRRWHKRENLSSKSWRIFAIARR